MAIDFIRNHNFSVPICQPRPLFEKFSNYFIIQNQSVGAQLLKIESQEEQLFLKQTFYPNAHNEGKDKDIWIGFSDQEQNGIFRWVDGEALFQGSNNN